MILIERGTASECGQEPLEITSLRELGVELPVTPLRVLKVAPPAERARGVMVKDAAELLSALKARGVL